MTDQTDARMVRKNTAVLMETAVGTEVVLMHLDSGRFHALRDTGLQIWRLLDETGDPAAIKALLHDRYEVPGERCDAEVETFLAALTEAGLVERV